MSKSVPGVRSHRLPANWTHATGYMSMHAHRSGQVGLDCQHIQSLVYAPVATNLPVALDEENLTDMVINKSFSRDTERDCSKRKLAADADGAPLSFEVNLRKEQRQYFFFCFWTKHLLILQIWKAHGPLQWYQNYMALLSHKGSKIMPTQSHS